VGKKEGVGGAEEEDYFAYAVRVLQQWDRLAVYEVCRFVRRYHWQRLLRQYLYFCTSKARKLSICCIVGVPLCAPIPLEL
jgi:hypothetical protein